MSCEKESSSREVDSDSKEIGGELRKSIISYTREFLMSLDKLDACKELPGGFDQSILSELHASYSSPPEQQQLPGKAPTSCGWTSSSSSGESAERWDSCKLRTKESISADSGRWRSQHLPQNSGNTGNLRSSFQQHNGILGSWSGSKLLEDGSEESTSEFQGARPSLLSRCSEPYRPPAFYKVASHSGGRITTLTMKQLIEVKTLATREQQRKDEAKLAGNQQLKETKDNMDPSPDDQIEESDADAHAELQEYFDMPVLASNKASAPTYLSVSVGPSYCTYEPADMYLKTESASHSHLAQVQEMPSKSQTAQDPGGICYEEKLQEQLLEGSGLFSLIDLADSESIGPIFPDEKNTMVEGDNFKSQSKFLNWFAACEKVASNLSPCDDKIGKKAWGEATGLKDKNLLCAAGALFSSTRMASIAEYGSSYPVLQDSCFPSGFSYDCHPSWEPQLDKSTRDKSLDSASGASLPLRIRERSETNSAPKCGQEADSNLTIFLHDEDSLIIDDAYIFRQDERKPIALKGGRSASSSSGSVELLESENLHQILSLPDPWSLESQMNAQKQFVNPSDSQARLRAQCTFQDPRKIYHNGYDPFAPNLVSHPFGELLVEPPIYEPSVQHFFTPTMRHAQSFNPHLRNTIPPEPVIYHQPHQIPYCQPEPNPLRSHALLYQRNVTPTLDVGRRGLLGEEGSKSAFCHLLQMQMRLAQMNLDAVSGADERVYGKPVSRLFL